jgi:hypothetical protein
MTWQHCINDKAFHFLSYDVRVYIDCPIHNNELVTHLELYYQNIVYFDCQQFVHIN